MGLENFNSDTTQIDVKYDGNELVSVDGVEWTACECEIDEIHRFEDPPDELDLVAHLRNKHGWEFEEARRKVLKTKEIEEAIN
jgi:hypothetical protein